ncbi:MAG: asparaginase [Chloroflexota bacterium]
MMDDHVAPLFELTRGKLVKSTHYGATAVVDAHGRLLTSRGDPHTVVFLRSSGRPLQAIAFFENGGPGAFGLVKAS